MIRAVGLTVFVATLLCACGPGSGTSGNISPITGADGSFSTCETESRATPYVPGMQVTSTSGALIVKLLKSVPGPPVKGTNTWTVEVDEAASGAALDGLAIGVAPYMPDHMHGTNPVMVTPAGPTAGPGTYTMTTLYLYMSGLWEVRMTLGGAAVVASGIDDAMIPICIP